MHLESRREVQAHRNRADDTVNSVGTDKPGVQLAGRSLGGLEGKISSQQPDSLARLVDRGASPPPVGTALGPHRGTEKSSPSNPPDASTPAEVGPGGRDCHLQLLLRKQRRLVTQLALERGHTSGRALHGVEGVLHPCKIICPGRGILGDNAAQDCLHRLVGALSLPVSLRMISRG